MEHHQVTKPHITEEKHTLNKDKFKCIKEHIFIFRHKIQKLKF